MKSILAIDLGTTGNRVIAFSKSGRILAESYQEFPQHFPKPGWVEHDPRAIWRTALGSLKTVLARIGAGRVEAIGITNQRETAILWDKQTGKPVMNAIVWQDRRTAHLCAQLSGAAAAIRDKTGLSLDPYFSATKIHWVLKNVPGVLARARRGDILFGTVDTWILWNLTGGRVHATDPSNASRTMLYNIQDLSYDPDLIELFGVPRACLGEVRPSAGLFGTTDARYTGKALPVTGILGDQQAALFAQGGWQRGVLKNTYGTGLFVMTATGAKVCHSGRLISTIAWQKGAAATYALEGSVFVAGSAIQWLRDGLNLIHRAAESEKLARTLKSNEGVYLVPALTGLGAPQWDPHARGLVIGLTRGTNRAHIVRAALEAMAYQTRDVVEEMRAVDPSIRWKTLRVDGGAVKNNFLMQFQADILGIRVERPAIVETTALGAAGIAGIAAGFWTESEFLERRSVDRVFHPRMRGPAREAHYRKWKDALSRSLRWHEDGE